MPYISVGPQGPPKSKYLQPPKPKGSGGYTFAELLAIKQGKMTPAQVLAARKGKGAQTTPRKTPNANAGFEAWYKSQFGKNGKTPGGAVDDSFNPLAGMPGLTPLTEMPATPTLPDGSDVPDTPARAFQRGKASLLNPKDYAAKVAAAYQPMIDALTGQGDRLQAGIGEANAMLDKNYTAQQEGALRGAQVIKDTAAQSNQSLTDLAARMASVAGGDPTAAAAVGQVSADTQAANSRFAEVAQQAQAAQAAAAQRDLGAAKLGYRAATDQKISDLRTAAGQAKTEGRSAGVKAIMDVMGFNDQQKTGQLNRDVAAQEAWLAGQIAGPQITAAKLANEGTRGDLVLKGHNAAVNDWTTLTTAQQNQYERAVSRWTNKNVAKQMIQKMKEGKTPAAELALADPSARAAVEQEVVAPMLSDAGPLVNPAQMYKQVRATMVNSYPGSSKKAIDKLAQIFVSKYMPAWNSYHSEGQEKSGHTWKLVNGVPAIVKSK